MGVLEELKERQLHSIPSDIWEKDCKYCQFRSSEENFEYGSRGKYERPCRIGKYEGKCAIWNNEKGEWETEHEAYKEHCESVRPTECFGICATCHYFNHFHDDVEDENAIYCTLADGPVNRRNTMPWVHAGYSKKITGFDYSYFTCDKYKVDSDNTKNLIKRALEGRIPMNFNPDTMQQLEYMAGEPIEEWKSRQQAYKDSKPENVKKKKLQDTIRQKMKKTEVSDDSND